MDVFLLCSIVVMVFLHCDFSFDISCFLLLGFDLNRVLQQGHIISSVIKKRAHNEHHFCPILYLRLLEKDSNLNREHNPLQVCAIELIRL